MTTDNLPTWPGAAQVYSRTCRILAEMGRSGSIRIERRGRRTIAIPSDDMNDAINALNVGDEERLKAFNFAHLHLDPQLMKGIGP